MCLLRDADVIHASENKLYICMVSVLSQTIKKKELFKEFQLMKLLRFCHCSMTLW